MTKHHKQSSLSKKLVFGRRVFLIIVALGAVCVALLFGLKKLLLPPSQRVKIYKRKPSDKSIVYLFKGGTPAENIRKLINRLGGIESIIGKNDIVILKPNSQWWAQGMTNTDSMIALIEMVLNTPSFSGEVVIADNHQMQEDEARGWTTDEPNGRYNLNGVVDWFNKKGHKNVTKYHWHDAGPNPYPLQGNAFGDAVVSGPDEGDGYVWDHNNFYIADNHQKCLMTYPIFTSSYSGATIDLKNGVWKDGAYTGQPLKFINMSSLNHHSPYAGVTASVKNLMGVVDMSCGYPSPEPMDTFNPHHIGVKSPFLARVTRMAQKTYRLNRTVGKMFEHLIKEAEITDFHFTGGVLGKWIETVCRPDLNIITAEWIGTASRLDLDKSTRPHALVASTDAVAADYVASKHVLLTETKRHLPNSMYCNWNDPDNKDGPFFKFLTYAAMETGGAMDETHIDLIGDVVL